MRGSLDRKFTHVFIWSIFISYFIFMVTYGIGNLKYGGGENLDFIQFKFNEINDKYDYLTNNINVGNIEENNREILYLEEMKNEISENLIKEGEFWLIDLKNLIKQKQDMLINGFLENSRDYKQSLDYIKLKNEIDEYNTYYNLKQKPLDYNESVFIKYFSLIFNSRIHQIALTLSVLGIFFILIRSTRSEDIGFWKLFLLTMIPIIFIQILSLSIWAIVDGKIDISYPVRIIEGFGTNLNVDLNSSILSKVIPLYKVIIFTFIVEISYILFLVTLFKIIDITFSQLYLKVIGIFAFMFGMVGILFTKYSGISFMSYGKFLDIIRGYEFVYRKEEFFSIYSFIASISIILIVHSFLQLYKKIYSK